MNDRTKLKKMGILVIDIQNDFCHDDGIFAQQGLNIKPVQEVTPRIKAFIDEVRKYNVPIIYTLQIESDEVSPENLKRQFASRKLVPVCAPNSWGSELYQLEPAEGEHIIEKHTYDPFSNPRLRKILDKRAVNTLVIAGVNTDVCIDTTVRRAFTENYNVVVPKDLVASVNDDSCHNESNSYLRVFNQFFGTVTESDYVLAYLKRISEKE